MVNINEEFPSKYLKAADLKGHAVKVKISNVSSEEIGGDRKLIAYFAGKDKGMVLNKTNARTIADAFGDETDNWTGADIEVFAMKVDFQGRMVDGLRVRIIPKPVNVAPNARQRQEEPAMAGDAPPPVDTYDNGFDDNSEIPF